MMILQIKEQSALDRISLDKGADGLTGPRQVMTVQGTMMMTWDNAQHKYCMKGLTDPFTAVLEMIKERH
jgi:hypothetical protein